MNINKAIKRPIEIEVSDPLTPQNAGEIAEWCNATVNAVDNTFTVPTREGSLRARHGDRIIRGVRGECYPIGGDIFDETYDIVEAS